MRSTAINVRLVVELVRLLTVAARNPPLFIAEFAVTKFEGPPDGLLGDR